MPLPFPGNSGLPDYIIDDARERLTEQDISFEDLLTDLETSKRTIEKERDEISALRKEAEELKIECREGYDRMLDLESFGGKIRDTEDEFKGCGIPG